MTVIALLPIKAHSSRVPGKNFKEIAGKPLFRWMLDELLATDFISRIVINTDARELLESAGLPEDRTKLQIRDRKPELCGDAVSMNEIIADDLAHTEARHYLMTHATNPAITRTTLVRAYTAYRQGLSEGKDSLFSVNRVQTRFYRQDASPVNHDPKNLIPTQELEPWYEENSCIYFFSPESFAASQGRIGESPCLFETPPLESSDIDELHDWSLAEILLLARAVQ